MREQIGVASTSLHDQVARSSIIGRPAFPARRPHELRADTQSPHEVQREGLPVLVRPALNARDSKISQQTVEQLAGVFIAQSDWVR